MTRTRVAVTADGRVDLDGDVLVPHRLPDEDGRVRVLLVPSHALLVAGDEVRIEVTVAAGRALEVIESCGTVAHDMRGGRAAWFVDVRLDEDAVLVWPSRPFVVADGADVLRLTHVDLAAGARVVLRETLVMGRTGGTGGRVRTTVRARLADRPLLAETIVAEPAGVLDAPLLDTGLLDAAPLDPALLGTPPVDDPRCLDTLLVLGARLEHPGAMQLDGEGTMLRATLPRPGTGGAGLADAVAAAVGMVAARLPTPRRAAEPVAAPAPRSTSEAWSGVR